MKGCLELASIEEANGQEDAQQMVQTLVRDFEKIIGEVKEGMEVANENSDETTADMLLAIHSSLEKHVWMLTSFLG